MHAIRYESADATPPDVSRHYFFCWHACSHSTTTLAPVESIRFYVFHLANREARGSHDCQCPSAVGALGITTANGERIFSHHMPRSQVRLKFVPPFRGHA